MFYYEILKNKINNLELMESQTISENVRIHLI